MTDLPSDHKQRAAAWFRSLRDDIVAAFENVEQTQGGEAAAGTFEITQTNVRPRMDRTPAVV